jgi:MFS family permease
MRAVLFAATFLMRPARRLAVRLSRRPYGRRMSLTISVLCMCFGSLIIACTPTYATIGIAAPILLALARIIEGLSLGGEYGASATYLSEVADPRASRFLFELPVCHADRRPADRDHRAAAAAERLPDHEQELKSTGAGAFPS